MVTEITAGSGSSPHPLRPLRPSASPPRRCSRCRWCAGRAAAWPPSWAAATTPRARPARPPPAPHLPRACASTRSRAPARCRPRLWGRRRQPADWRQGLPAPHQGWRALRALRQPPPRERRRDRRRGTHVPRRGPLRARVVRGSRSPPSRWALPAGVGRRHAQRPAPNVVVIMTDDQTAASLGPDAPGAALLADEGTRFEQAIASFPLCCPARATNLTGQYAHNHGVLHNGRPVRRLSALDHTNSLPVWLQAAGYRTMHRAATSTATRRPTASRSAGPTGTTSPTRAPSTTRSGG